MPTATNTDEQSFLKAIYDAPDDDTPRLVFADWLDERGSADDKARAALIRAQCQAEYLAPGSKERKRLERAAKALIKANEKRWLKDLRAAKLGSEHTFRRGFLDGLKITPTKFVQRGADLFRIAPTIRTIKFPNAANELTKLAESPFLAQLANVDLTQMCTCGYCHIDDELRDLFKSKHAQSLRYLNVSRDRIDADVATALAKSTNLANLTALDLSDNPLDGAGLAALAKSKHLGKLEALILSRISLPPTTAELEDFRAFAKAKHFPALTRLELSGNAINAPCVAALVTAPFAKQLKVLDLSKNRVGEQGVKALVGAEWPNLELLDLSGNQLGQRAIKWLKAKFGKKVKV
jgi:uncharacterized protein (TIGR02996 family)